MIVDDHVTIDIVSGRLVVARPTTTTRWWLRLSMAVRGSADGQLSKPLPAAGVSINRIDDLDRYFRVVDPRSLTAVMADVLTDHPVGALGAEAIAAAAVTDDGLLVSPPTATKALRAAAKAYGIEVGVVAG